MPGSPPTAVPTPGRAPDRSPGRAAAARAGEPPAGRRSRHAPPLGGRGPRRRRSRRPAATAGSSVARWSGSSRPAAPDPPAGSRGLGRDPGSRLSAAYRRRYGEVPMRGPDPRCSVPADRARAFRERAAGSSRRSSRYLDAPTGPARTAAERRRVGARPRSSARASRRTGMPLGDAVSMFVAARRPFLAELRRGRPAARRGRRSRRQLYDAVDRAARPPAARVRRPPHGRRPGGRARLDRVAVEPRRGSPRMTILLPAADLDPGARVRGDAARPVARAAPRRSSSCGRSGCCATAIGAGAEAVAAANGWNEGLYRAWYLTGAVWTAGWLGPRDGVPARPDAVRLHVRRRCSCCRALFTFIIRNSPNYAGAGAAAAPVPHRRRSSSPSRSASRRTSPTTRWPRFAARRDDRRDDPVASC